MADLSRAVDAAVDRLDVQHLRPPARSGPSSAAPRAATGPAAARSSRFVRGRPPGPARPLTPSPHLRRRQACLQRCTEPVLKGERAVTAGMGRMQEHLARCTGRCEDLARQALPAGAGESQIARAQAQLEACVAKCAAEQAGQVRPPPPRSPSLVAASSHREGALLTPTLSPLSSPSSSAPARRSPRSSRTSSTSCDEGPPRPPPRRLAPSPPPGTPPSRPPCAPAVSGRSGGGTPGRQRPPRRSPRGFFPFHSPWW